MSEFFSEFINMGGYAAFVWPAYGLTALVMVVVLMASVRSLKETQATLDRLQGEMSGPDNDKEAPE